MASLSLMHVFVILLVVFVPALILAGIFWLARRSSRAGGGNVGTLASSPRSPAGVDVERRLAALGDLLAKGRITQEEYQRQRAKVIDAV